MSLPEVLKVMVEGVKAGKNLSRLHDGDPSFYGAIQELMDGLDKEGIEYFRIPGVSCFLGAAAALNRELTLPNISQTVIITRPEGRTPVPEAESISKLAHQATMVIFLGTPHIARVVEYFWLESGLAFAKVVTVKRGLRAPRGAIRIPSS